MYPILLSLGPIKIYTFGLFLSLAVVIASFVVWRQGTRLKIDGEKLIDLILWELILGLIGARTFYIASHWGDFTGLPVFYWLLIFHFPGLSFLGGVVGGGLGAWVFARRSNLSFWQAGDLLSPGISLGEAIGSLGAFFSGSAYGAVTSLPWGLPVIGLLGRRHPTQIYEAIMALMIFLTLLKLKKFFEERKLGFGFITLAYFLLFGLSHFLLEFFLGEGVYWGGWRANQLVNLGFILISIVLIYKRLGRSVKQDFLTIFGKIKKNIIH